MVNSMGHKYNDLRSVFLRCVIEAFLGIAIVIVSTDSENEKATLHDYFYEYIQSIGYDLDPLQIPSTIFPLVINSINSRKYSVLTPYALYEVVYRIYRIYSCDVTAEFGTLTSVTW